jgi:site-specific recombinase XerD
LVSNTLETSLIDQKIERATEGLEPYFLEHLKTKISRENGLVIAEYISSMRIETNLSDNHRRGVITSLKLLSEFSNNKYFIDMTKEDVLSYLDHFRKPDEYDRLHKWISTYNQRLVAFIRFFKWLHNSDIESSKRQKPLVINNIPALKRREKN